MKNTDDIIKSVSKDKDIYPETLRTINDPPEELFYRGNFNLWETPCLAVVGARRATPYGKWVAYNVAKRAAEHGITIVSGMAAGIDACGHKGALDAGGKTIAVLGCGPDICYPKTNKDLMAKICQEGLVLSEYPPGREPIAWQFPARNRIISGLSYGVVVVEAGLNSGSLITAGFALNQGKEVFAVPGNINNTFSKGTNKLIQDGATPIVEIDDILEMLGISNIKSKKADEISLGHDERLIIKMIKDKGPLSIDSLCMLTGKAPSTVGALVTVMEMKGLLQVSMGKIHVAK